MVKRILLSKSVAGNIIANYGTTLSGSVLSLIFTPIFIGYIGIEAYGITGFVASLMVFLNFLDLGMGQTVNREMAKYYKEPARVIYINNLVFSLQTIYISLGLVCSLVLVLLAPALATKWFNAQTISAQTATWAFVILAISIGARWPYAFYASALRGMQYQVLLSSNEIFWNIVKTAGSFVVLRYYSPTLLAFLGFQCVVVLLQTLSTIFMCWHFIEKPAEKRKFDSGIIKSLSGYIASMGTASILVTLISQLDKLILSKILPGIDYGYYIFSNNISSTLFIASIPIGTALFPLFARHWHDEKKQELLEAFHKYTRFLAILLLPVFLVLIFFTKEVLWTWTRNEGIAQHTPLLIRVLLIGTVMDAFMIIPNTLLLASNKSRFILITHLVAFGVMIPVIYYLSIHFRALGGAISVSFIMGGYFLFEAPFFFRYTLKGQYLKWIWQDILKVALPLIIIIVPLKMLLPEKIFEARLPAFLILSGIGIVLLLIAVQLSGLPALKKYMFWKRS